MKKKGILNQTVVLALIVSVFSGCTSTEPKTETNQNAGMNVSAINNSEMNTVSDINAIIEKGYAAYQSHDYMTAIDWFKKAYNIDSTSLVALISLGNLYYDTDNAAKAIDYYNKSLSIDTNNLDVRCDMATCYFRLGNVDTAIAINKRIIDINPAHAMAHYNLSVQYGNKGMMEEALKEQEIYNQIASGK